MKPRILFLCTGNSARSQMAEALLTLIAGDHFDVASAGTHPVGVHPMTVAVMKELGVERSGYRSKSVQEFIGQQFDYVITVCDRAKETCPIFPSASRLLHWSFDDPASVTEAVRREAFVRVRDEIADRICRFCLQEMRLSPAALTCYCCVTDTTDRGR
ncbi:Protein ArsC [Nitrospira japonica]|uniref:Protein ArsC n=1 Tax=Nitrospira japonica TaxID=1325564 RepID=A0A1W1I7G0_9BACT|nr:arsenate reductase ArsC [Nitrospira japonica]SLM48861.1 Protein ArsC [Nitrospira japonica]